MPENATDTNANPEPVDAVVIGAGSGGIGTGIAEACARAAMNVVVADIDTDGAARVAAWRRRQRARAHEHDSDDATIPSPKSETRRAPPRTPCARPRHRDGRAGRRAAPATRPARSSRRLPRADASPGGLGTRRVRVGWRRGRAWAAGRRVAAMPHTINRSRRARPRNTHPRAQPGRASSTPVVAHCRVNWLGAPRDHVSAERARRRARAQMAGETRACARRCVRSVMCGVRRVGRMIVHRELPATAFVDVAGPCLTRKKRCGVERRADSKCRARAPKRAHRSPPSASRGLCARAFVLWRLYTALPRRTARE